MRKRNITKVADTIFWYSLYFLPILTSIICLLNGSDTYWTHSVNLTFFDFMDGFFAHFGIGFFPIYDSLSSLSNVISVDWAGNETILLFFSWFVSMYILHLFVDFILFIPRIAHKWMKDCTDTE